MNYEKHTPEEVRDLLNQKDYYVAPAQEVFDDIKEQAINLWNTYDDQFGYATGKISRIKDIGNIQDNAWYMVAMFDPNNQAKLLEMVKPETREQILKYCFPVKYLYGE